MGGDVPRKRNDRRKNKYSDSPNTLVSLHVDIAQPSSSWQGLYPPNDLRIITQKTI
jgi:hypothetical protein